MEGTVDCEAISNIIYLPMESLDYPPFLNMHFPLEKDVPFLCWSTKGYAFRTSNHISKHACRFYLKVWFLLHILQPHVRSPSSCNLRLMFFCLKGLVASIFITGCGIPSLLSLKKSAHLSQKNILQECLREKLVGG